MSRSLPTQLRNAPKVLLLTLAATAALSACKREAEAPSKAPPETAAPAGFAFKNSMTPADFAEHVRVLASDEF